VLLPGFVKIFEKAPSQWWNRQVRDKACQQQRLPPEIERGHGQQNGRDSLKQISEGGGAPELVVRMQAAKAIEHSKAACQQYEQAQQQRGTAHLRGAHAGPPAARALKFSVATRFRPIASRSTIRMT